MATPGEPRKGGERAGQAAGWPSSTARSTMISAASRSSALRNSSSLRSFGDAEARRRAKHLDASERLAFETAHELFDVDAEVSERLRHIAHDTRPLVADDLQRDKTRRLFGLCGGAALDRDTQA